MRAMMRKRRPSRHKVSQCPALAESKVAALVRALNLTVLADEALTSTCVEEFSRSPLLGDVYNAMRRVHIRARAIDFRVLLAGR